MPISEEKFTSVRIFYRVEALNSGNVLNTGNRFLYTWMGRFAALQSIIDLWATLRLMAPSCNDGPLCGPFPIFRTLPEFSDFTIAQSSTLYGADIWLICYIKI